jgi:hypothetical protein
MNDYHKREIADNPSTPADMLTQLATDKDGWVRQRVAQNPSTPVNILVQLAADEDRDVRLCVVGNPSTPADALALLWADTDKHVRWGVARHPSTPADVLAQLATDTDRDVRLRVAVNPSTPSEALAVLWADTDDAVRQAVDRVLSTRANTRKPADNRTVLNQTDFVAQALECFKRAAAPATVSVDVQEAVELWLWRASSDFAATVRAEAAQQQPAGGTVAPNAPHGAGDNAHQRDDTRHPQRGTAGRSATDAQGSTGRPLER